MNLPNNHSLEGKLIIFSAPSGSGKTSIARQLIKSRKDLSFSISACTRERRAQEQDQIDYYFVSTDEFKQKIKNDDFIEWEEVYEDMFYGTLKKEVKRLWNLNKHVVFDVDVKGGLKLIEYFKDRAIAIFISPPSLIELEKRLRARSTETEEALLKRISKASYEMNFKEKFDYIIINDELSRAAEEVNKIVSNFLD